MQVRQDELVDDASTKPKLMAAKEAITLTNKNAITIENVAINIGNAASNGINRCRFFDVMLPYDVMCAIMRAGYLLSQEKGPLGENIIVIGW